MVAFNALAFSGLIIAGMYVAWGDSLMALIVGIPSGFIFGFTYFKGFPFRFGRDQ